METKPQTREASQQREGAATPPPIVQQNNIPAEQLVEEIKQLRMALSEADKVLRKQDHQIAVKDEAIKYLGKQVRDLKKILEVSVSR